MLKKHPRMCFVIPCYNEEAVLPVTAPKFLAQLEVMAEAGQIASDSRILLVDDGSKDSTWQIIGELAAGDKRVFGIRQSHNRGQQNALYAGLMEVRGDFDFVITADCDGQDDISAASEMADAYLAGADVVYGVRKSRKKDSFLKRFTAESYYRFLNGMGAETVYNHADYRLMSNRVLDALSQFSERVYLRGMVPMIGFNSSIVYYERPEREAGESHYPLGKMVNLALDGLTGFSVKPLRLILWIGVIFGLAGFGLTLWQAIAAFGQLTLWSFLGLLLLAAGVILVCLGIIALYIGQASLEIKNRPKYIISDRTEK